MICPTNVLECPVGAFTIYIRLPYIVPSPERPTFSCSSIPKTLGVDEESPLNLSIESWAAGEVVPIPKRQLGIKKKSRSTWKPPLILVVAFESLVSMRKMGCPPLEGPIVQELCSLASMVLVAGLL